MQLNLGGTPTNRLRLLALSIFVVVSSTGCATTQVVGGDSPPMGSGQLPRPNLIVVYNFAATPNEIAETAPDASHGGEPVQQSQQDIDTGRQLGALVASKVVDEINDLGIRAALGSQARPALGDYILRGTSSRSRRATPPSA